MNDNIIKDYTFLKKKYNDIVEIDPKRLKEIITLKDKELSSKNANKYILISSMLILTILIFSIGFNFSKQIINIIVEHINGYSFSFLKNHISETSGLMFFFKVTSLILIFIAPVIFNYLIKKRIIETHHKIDVEQGNFIYTMSILGVFVIGVLMIIFNVYFNLDINTIILNYFKFFLSIIFSILLYTVFLLLLLNIPYLKRLKKNEYNSKFNFRIDIGFELLTMLKKLDTVEYLDDIELIRDIEGNIYNISHSIKNISYDYETEETEIERKKLIGISNAFFIKFMNLIHMEKSNTINIKQEIINYFNKFIGGSIIDLPTQQIKEKKKVNKKITFLLLIIYLLIPFAILFTIKYVYEINIDELIQSLFKMLYIIWAFIGVFSNPLIKDKENKELIKEILSVFGK